jgi:hypothetical protein
MLNDGHHNVVRDGRSAFSLIGVFASEEIQLTVQDNEVSAALYFGILARVLSGDLLLARNRVLNCGWAGPFGWVGVLAWSDILTEPVVASIRVEGCEILDTGVAPDGTLATSAVIGLNVTGGNCQVIGNRVVSVNLKLAAQPLEHRALKLVGPAMAAGPIRALGSSAVVANNVLRGPGLTHLVEAPIITSGNAQMQFHKMLFNGNFCDHLAPRATEPTKNASTVLLSGRHVAASANQITALSAAGTLSINSLDCLGSAGTSVVGNVTSGAIVNLGTTSPGPPPGSFNIQV